jgi:hypothetical protein
MDTGELDRQELLTFASSHLMTVHDEALLVLKAHLVAESLLYEVLNDILPNAGALDTARLSFSQLISLMESLRASNREKWLWLALRRLNSLRNEFAHSLSLDRLRDKRDQFLESTVPWITPPADAEGLLRLKYVLLILCAQLADIRHGVETAGPIA